MANEEHTPAPPGWYIVVAFIALFALIGYAWYRHSKDQNWNPFSSGALFESNQPILPISK